MSAAPPPLTPDEFQAQANVSRETFAKLKIYAELLLEWQQKMNLVGESTLTDLWRRHFLDSAQLHKLIPTRARNIVDLGSGAGFPGLVLAAMGGPAMHLVEADGKKCAFLSEVIAKAGISATVHNARSEDLDLRGDVVIARALAPLARLLGFATPRLVASGVCIFPKGKSVEDELTEAGKRWKMDVERFPSQSDPSGTILRLTGVRKRNAERR